MARAHPLADVESLAIIAAIAVAAYVGYRIWQDKAAITNSPAGQAAGALSQAAYNTATGEVLTDNPIAHGLSELWTAISDPFGNSLATDASTDPAMASLQGGS